MEDSQSQRGGSALELSGLRQGRWGADKFARSSWRRWRVRRHRTSAWSPARPDDRVVRGPAPPAILYLRVGKLGS